MALSALARGEVALRVEDVHGPDSKGHHGGYLPFGFTLGRLPLVTGLTNGIALARRVASGQGRSGISCFGRPYAASLAAPARSFGGRSGDVWGFRKAPYRPSLPVPDKTEGGRSAEGAARW